MKLGDNMTAVEACNVWGDGCSRKTRPPRIGEIPRYTAVDEESPGAASRRTSSTSPCSESRLQTDGMLELRLSTHGDVFSTKTSPVQKSQKCDDEECNRIKDNSMETRIPSVTVVTEVNRLQPELEREARETDDRGNLMRISSTPSQEIREVRKDSALYLEEVEGLKDLRESLRSRSPRSLTPRRESSGYASNLGTFDDERRASDVDLTALRERRRSSTKRLTSETFLPKRVTRNEENVIDERISAPADQEVEKRVSTSGLDMFDIEEVRDKIDPEFIAPVQLPVSKEIISDIGIEEESSRVSNTPKIHSTGALGSSNEILSYAEVLAKSGTPTSRPGVNRPRILSRVESFDAGDFTGKINHNAIVNQLSTKVQMPRKRIVHQYSTPNFSSMELESILEKPSEKSPEKPVKFTVETRVTVEVASEPDDAESITKPIESLDSVKMIIPGKNLPKSIKVYQLLSTQSEDRGDGVPNLADRRISLQISRREDDQMGTSGDEKLKEKNEEEIPDVSIPKENSTSTVPGTETEESSVVRHLTPSMASSSSLPVRKLSTPAEMGSSQHLLGDSGIGIRPIYPYCPYSPYGSPQGSPRTRRRPLRESRRVSIDNRQGALQLNQYKLLDNIGQGSYGIVKLAYNEEDKTHYAMKILSKKKLMKKAGIFGRMAPGRKGLANPLAKVYREIALLKKLDHPNVVKLVEVLDDPDEDNLYLVFELVQKGEVLQLPTEEPFDEETARSHFRDIVLGVEYLHYQRIVHRDIKPSNLLVDSEGHIKVADLGVSAELRAAGELLSGPAGTPAFAAPETTTPGAQYSGTLCRIEVDSPTYNKSFCRTLCEAQETGGKTSTGTVAVVLCDVWSMGVTLYSLVTGRVPWDGAGSIIGVQAAVRSEPLKFPEKPEISDSLRDLISKMLEKEPDSRISLTDIKNHPWVTKDGAEILPSETENCRLPVTVTDEEVTRVVTRVPKLDTLILIKTMLKQHSFQNPFLPKRSTKSVCSDAIPSGSSSSNIEGSEVSENSNSRAKKFHKAGRSNSAPDTFESHPSDRQVSVESPLPPVTEALVQESESEKR